ncbi:MAG: hypothetical protein EBW86_04935, partial [Rhodobacteraceae bacterium]|nr:hypothetical protein [Paracoccaceae bacterium]
MGKTDLSGKQNYSHITGKKRSHISDLSIYIFTRFVLSGVDIANDQQQKIQFGTKRITALASTNAKLESLGADVQQAKTIVET